MDIIIKTRSSKSRKIGIVTNGLVHGFGQELVIFPDFNFKENRTEKCVYDILEGRNAFLDYKKKKFKKSKNRDFSKGLVHGFGQKLVIFPNFYFRENRPRKCVVRYSRTKKCLSRL